MRINITVLLFFIFTSINLYGQDNEGLINFVSADNPRLEVSETVWDFGTIDQGEQTNHVFVLKNAGQQDLIIKKIKSTCGCTIVDVTKRIIRQNESAELTATFNSLGRQGRQLKKIYITTNSPFKPLTVLVVKGFVKTVPGPRIAVEPKDWDFGLVEPDTAPDRTFILKNNGVKDLVISEINTSSGCRAELLAGMTIKPNQESVMHVILNKLTMAGLVEDFVRIASNDTSTPTVHIRITGYVKGTKPRDLKILSDRIDLGVIDFSNVPQSAYFEVPIFNTGDEPLTIEKVETPKRFIPQFKTPFKIPPRENKFISFKIKDNNNSGTFKNIIIINSDDMSIPRKKITLFGYITR